MDERNKPTARKETGSGHAGRTPQHERTEVTTATSPYRVLFAIVPLLVIAIVGTDLLGLWGTSNQEVAREEPRNEEAPLSPDAMTFEPPAPVEAPPAVDTVELDIGAVMERLAGADPEQGARNFRMCIACHSAEKGAPARIGPNLWGIVDSAKGADPAYVYSAALKAKGGAWTYQELAEFLHNPRQFAPGTSMSFWGIRDDARLADLLAYMATLADVPTPLPDQAVQR